MRKFVKLLVFALAITLVASMFIVTPSAAEVVDPNELKPGSERVIFIKDAPRDENYKYTGEALEGDGSGFDAQNPLAPVEHESFDPAAEHPKYHLTTAFYQATELLKSEGGTIVVCGPVHFGPGESYGSGASTRDVFTATFGTNTIKITSVYDGVDYRETAGAKITIETPAEIGMYGQSIWENIDIVTVSPGRVISFGAYPTLVGEGVNCYPADEEFIGVAANHVSLSSGHRYAKSKDVDPNLVVKSGSYNVITGAMWGVVDTQENENANVKLVLEGTTTVYGQIIGTTGQKGKFSGNVDITINGGTYECDINGVGVTGMMNTDGKLNIKINGGDFTNAWSINTASSNAANNLPAVATLDFSGWKGELSALASAYGAVTDFENIIFPEGVTADDVIAAATTPTTPAATTPVTEPVTTPATDPTAQATEPVKQETEAQATTPTATTPATSTPAEEGGSNIGLIIGIVVAVVVVAAVIVVIAMKKKKA